jgi:hypothetical protein
VLLFPTGRRYFSFLYNVHLTCFTVVIGGTAVRSVKLNIKLYVLLMLKMRVGKSSFLRMPLMSSRLKQNGQRLLFFAYLLDLFSSIPFYSVSWKKQYFPVYVTCKGKGRIYAKARQLDVWNRLIYEGCILTM